MSSKVLLGEAVTGPKFTSVGTSIPDSVAAVARDEPLAAFAVAVAITMLVCVKLKDL
jgi:hypothetical protein